tara:strand:- start:476 stop:577 length:102 start_codon:yes stop_codon:yes gene_type:complete
MIINKLVFDFEKLKSKPILKKINKERGKINIGI